MFETVTFASAPSLVRRFEQLFGVPVWKDVGKYGISLVFPSEKGTRVRINMIVSLLQVIFFSSTAWAVDGNLGLDLGMANNTRANVFGFAAIRYMPSTISLAPRAHVAASAYAYSNLDYGLTAAGVESQAISLGLLYHRESRHQGLDPSVLPGWKLPEEELEQISIHSLTGGSLAVSFGNRQGALGVGAFYVGTSNDLEVYTHAVELNTSIGGKFLNQVVLGLSAVDVLDQVDGTRIEVGARWGVLNVPGPFWSHCIPKSDSYDSAGGVEIDASYSLREGDMYFLGVAGDVPLSCNVAIHGGVQHHFLAENSTRYGAGILLELPTMAFGYDVQLRTGTEELEHVHLLSVQLRLSDVLNSTRR